MSNYIKIGESDKRNKQVRNFRIGVDGSDDYGPTSVSGFYKGINPPVNGYVIYMEKASQGPSIHVANDNEQCIFFLKSFGATGDTINNVLDWAATQDNIYVQSSLVVDGDLTGGTETVTGYTNTAEIYFDPGNTLSYPGSGTTLTNIGTSGNVTGTLGTLSGVSYEGGIANGVLNFDGGTDTISFGTNDFGNTITVTAWVYPRLESSINCLISNCAANTTTDGFKMSWNAWTTTDYNMNFEAGNGSSGNTSATAINTVVENTWQHLGYVFDKTNRTIKFYRNGSEVAVASGGTPVANIGTNKSWWIGSIGGSSYQMDANLGEFRLYKSIKSSSDILDEYNNTKSRYGL
jgi:hypothetical protein